MDEVNSHDPTKPSDDETAPEPLQMTVALAWAALLASVGSALCGMAISKFGMLGAVSLWGLGSLGGFVGRKILGTNSRLVAGVLAGVCCLAFVIAEICWLHWNTVQGAESWQAAIKLFPTFLTTSTYAAVIGGLFTLFGATSAWQQVAYRYRVVMVRQ